MTTIDTGKRIFNVENMLRCALRYAQMTSRRRIAVFIAADMFGLGSGSAIELMNHLGLDPETGQEIRSRFPTLRTFVAGDRRADWVRSPRTARPTRL